MFAPRRPASATPHTTEAAGQVEPATTARLLMESLRLGPPALLIDQLRQLIRSAEPAEAEHFVRGLLGQDDTDPAVLDHLEARIAQLLDTFEELAVETLSPGAAISPTVLIAVLQSYHTVATSVADTNRATAEQYAAPRTRSGVLSFLGKGSKVIDWLTNERARQDALKAARTARAAQSAATLYASAQHVLRAFAEQRAALASAVTAADTSLHNRLALSAPIGLDNFDDLPWGYQLPLAQQVAPEPADIARLRARQTLLSAFRTAGDTQTVLDGPTLMLHLLEASRPDDTDLPASLPAVFERVARDFPHADSRAFLRSALTSLVDEVLPTLPAPALLATARQHAHAFFFEVSPPTQPSLLQGDQTEVHTVHLVDAPKPLPSVGLLRMLVGFGLEDLLLAERGAVSLTAAVQEANPFILPELAQRSSPPASLVSEPGPPPAPAGSGRAERLYSSAQQVRPTSSSKSEPSPDAPAQPVESEQLVRPVAALLGDPDCRACGADPQSDRSADVMPTDCAVLGPCPDCSPAAAVELESELMPASAEHLVRARTQAPQRINGILDNGA